MHLHLPASASRRSAGALRSTAKRPGRARSLAGLLASLVLLGSLAATAIVSASTPVTVGFKDFGYGPSGASRATGDKPQSKLWYTNAAGTITWWSGLFLKNSTKAEYHIYRLNSGTNSWTDTGTRVDPRDASHADYYFDSAANKLYVLSAGQPAAGCAPADPVTDDLRLYRYSFSAGVYTLDIGFPVVVDTCGSYTATIAKDSVGTLWAAYPQGLDVKVARSASDGDVSTLTDEDDPWTAPYRLPVQATNLNPGSSGTDPDITAVVAFGPNKIGVAWSNHSTSPATISFAVHADGGADDAAAWGTTPETALANFADDHLNVKTDPDGNVWIVTKTSLDGDPVKTKALIQLLQRGSGGAWTTHLVSTVADLNTRPQLLISATTPRVAYILMSAPNGGGSAYYKSAPISGTSENLKFATGDATNSMPGVPFISSQVETQIDDVTTTKQNITAATGLVAEGSDLLKKVYLHNFLSIASSDVVGPVGTVSINAAAPTTGNPLASVAVPATDAGSGMSEVRLANVGTINGSGVLSGAGATTFAYTTPVAWTLSAGDGTKTVYAQWRDGAGNWSAVQSDTITLDTATPTGTVTINGGAADTNSTAVTLALTAADGTGSGVTQVKIANGSDPSGATPQAFAASIPWTLTAGADGSRTVSVQFIDAAGNISAGAISDAITLDTAPPATGTVTIGGGPLVPSLNVTLTLGGAGGDATAARVSNSADMSGAAAISLAGGSWTLAAGPDGPRTVYAEWADALGNWSAAVASNTVTLDQGSPSGTVSINGGAALTNSLTVSLGVPSPDGDVTQVRISNSPTLSAGVLSTGTTFAYTTPVAWTLSAGDGTKTVYAQWRDGAGNWSAVQSDTITLDTATPTGTVTINGGAADTNSTAVTLALTADGTGSAVSTVSLSNSADMSGATSQAFAASVPWTLVAGADGTRTVYVQYTDAAGNISGPGAISDAINLDLDTVAPTAGGPPVQRFVAGTASGIPVRLVWTPGTDAASGIASYVLQRKLDTGAFVTIATPTSALANVSLRAGHTYRFRVASVDGAGNVSSFVAGPAFKALAYQERSTAVRYRGIWRLQISTAFYGARAKYTRARLASATFTFTGRNFAWVAPRNRYQGRARVYVDGRLVTTVNLYSATSLSRQIVFTRAWAVSRTHTVRIVGLATAGHPRVTVDAFLVLR